MDITQKTDSELREIIRAAKAEIRARAKTTKMSGIDAKRFKSVQHNNTSGHKGVTFSKNANKWQAKIGAGAGKTKHLGYFKTIEDAIEARKLAESELWHN